MLDGILQALNSIAKVFQDGLTSLKVNTINETTATNGVTVDGLNIKDGKLNTDNSVVTENVTDGAVTSRKFKPTLDVAQGTSAAMVLANTDYDVATITVTPEVTSTVIIRFKGYGSLTAIGTMTGSVYKGATRDATNVMLFVNQVAAQQVGGMSRSWKFTGVTAAATTFKVCGRCNIANIGVMAGSIEVEVIAE